MMPWVQSDDENLEEVLMAAVFRIGSNYVFFKNNYACRWSQVMTFQLNYLNISIIIVILLKKSQMTNSKLNFSL